MVASLEDRVLDLGLNVLDAETTTISVCSSELTTIAIALVMAPAAYHRMASPKAVSEDLLLTSTRLLIAAMIPLAISICATVWPNRP